MEATKAVVEIIMAERGDETRWTLTNIQLHKRGKEHMPTFNVDQVEKKCLF